MKKLTKLHIILIVLLVAVIAGSVYFVSSYQKAQAKQPDIRDEINMALNKLELEKENNDPSEFKQQLDELQSKINKLGRDEPLFPKKPPTVEIGDLVVDTVQRLNLCLLKISPDDEAGTVTIESGGEEDSQGNKYNKAEFEIKVKGDLGRINSLIGEIENTDVATVTIEDLEIEYTKEEVEEDRYIPAYWQAEFTIVTLYQ